MMCLPHCKVLLHLSPRNAQIGTGIEGPDLKFTQTKNSPAVQANLEVLATVGWILLHNSDVSYI